MDTHTSRVASSAETSFADKSSEHPARVSDAARRKRQPGIKLQIAIRLLAAMATLAAALVMFLSEQKTEFFGLSIVANYKFSPAFKFFVIGNAAACAYAVLSLTVVGCCGSTLLCVQFLDTLAMGLVMAAAAAATAVGYIGKKGNSVAMWNAVCGFTERFCNHSTMAIGCSYIGFVLLLLVCTLTSLAKSSS